MRLSVRASARAAESTTGPRAVLMRKAVGFIRASCSRPISPFVAGVRGQCRETISDWESSSSRDTCLSIDGSSAALRL